MRNFASKMQWISQRKPMDKSVVYTAANPQAGQDALSTSAQTSPSAQLVQVLNTRMYTAASVVLSSVNSLLIHPLHRAYNL